MKNKSHASYTYYDYGIYFGGGFDFYVITDFKTLGSTLGHLYDITGYNIYNKNTHLFGEKDTEIIECKVYKVAFLWYKWLFILLFIRCI